MNDRRTFDRHIDTLAALNVVTSAALIAVAAWAVGGLSASVNRGERELRILWAAALAGGALLFFLLWMLLHLRARAGRLAQIGVAAVLLPVVPIGSAFGGYALWVLGKRGAKVRFARGAPRPVGVHPYPGALAVAIVLGLLAVAIVPLKLREVWLAAQVAEAARTASAREEAIADQAARLRQAGLIDNERPHRARR